MDSVKGSGCWLLVNPQAGVRCIGKWFRDTLRFRDCTMHDVLLVGDSDMKMESQLSDLQ